MLSPIAFDWVSVNTPDQVDPALAPLILSSASIRVYSWCALNEEPVRSGILGIQQRATPEPCLLGKGNWSPRKEGLGQLDYIAQKAQHQNKFMPPRAHALLVGGANGRA